MPKTVRWVTYSAASVALSADGNTTYVSAYRDNVGSQFDQGSSYCFSLIPATVFGGITAITAADANIQGAIVSTGSLSLIPSQMNRPIDLGTNTVGSLGLTNAELDLVTTGVPALVIGDSERAAQSQ